MKTDIKIPCDTITTACFSVDTVEKVFIVALLALPVWTLLERHASWQRDVWFYWSAVIFTSAQTSS